VKAIAEVAAPAPKTMAKIGPMQQMNGANRARSPEANQPEAFFAWIIFYSFFALKDKLVMYWAIRSMSGCFIGHYN